MRQFYRLLFCIENGDTLEEFRAYMAGKVIMSRFLNNYTYDFLPYDIDSLMLDFPYFVISLEKI